LLKNLTSIAIATIVVCPLIVAAEEQASTEQQITAAQEPASVQQSTEYESLPTLVVEGSAERPGMFGTVPDSTGLKDTASLLQKVPGANVIRNGPLTGIAQYRGLNGNRVNVDLDGANFKEVGPNSMDPPLSHVPAPLVESLQVYRGIAPVSSGIETIGGTVKATARKGHFADGTGTKIKLHDELEISGMITGGYGSVDDGWFTGGVVSIANKNHKLYGGGIVQQGRNYKYRDDLRMSPTEYTRGVWNIGYGFQQDGHEAGVNYSQNATGKTGTPALPMDIMYVRGGMTSADYSWNMGNGHVLETNLYYQNMRHGMNNFTLRPPPTIKLTGMDFLREMTTDVQAGGLDFAYSMPVWTGDLKFGYNMDLAEHNAILHDPNNGSFFIDAFNNARRNRYSFFGEWDGEVMEDLNLEVGLRYAHISTNANTVNYNGLPMMAQPAANKLRDDFNNADRSISDNDVDLVSILRYSMNSTMDVEVGFGIKNRAPSYQERYIWLPLETTGGLADGRNYIGDINLENETAYQAELGFDWHTDRAYFSPRAFYHYVNNYIQGTPTTNVTAQNLSNAMLGMVGAAPTTVLQFSNINAQLYGVDFDAGYSITDHWRVDAGLSWVRGQRVGSVSDDLFRIAPLNGRIQLTFEHSGWMGAVETVLVNSQSNVSSFNGEESTPGYVLLNIRGSYEPIKGLTIATGIENALDDKHFDHLAGTSRVLGNADVPVGSDIPQRGRNVYATMAYSW
jgi:iron complex outermembrane recepter protein